MAIHFQRHTFQNGLRLVVHEDASTPLASCFVSYFVGSRDENPKQTGLAHLVEHFMFCGSKNIPEYDVPLDKVGAQNNAFTTDDVTCYYITLPANNIETALWLESDRMLELAFKKKELEIQKQVVSEEFKEHFLNKPFGDMWMIFNDLVFEKHPYKWLPIGKELSHIESVTMDCVKSFYNKYYTTNNAVIAIAGNVKFDEMVVLVEKWFGKIKGYGEILREIEQESLQTAPKKLEVVRNIPYSMLLKAWKMGGRICSDFYALDLLSDMLGSGKSSFLYQELVEKKKIFTDISASITATFDPGIFVISGRPADNVSLEDADIELNKYLYSFKNQKNIEHSLQKVKNNVESVLLKNEIKIEDRCSTLALSETFHCVEMFENDLEKYFQVTPEQILHQFDTIIIKEKENTLFYQAAKEL